MLIMKGKIVSFRRGRHTQYTNQMIVAVDGNDKRESADNLKGKAVVWTSPAKKEIKGKVAGAHGNKGNVRVIFDTGMPGQCLNSSVNIS